MWVNISGGIDCTRGVIVVKGQDQRNGDLAEVETVSVALARPKLEKSPGETPPCRSGIRPIGPIVTLALLSSGIGSDYVSNCDSVNKSFQPFSILCLEAVFTRQAEPAEWVPSVRIAQGDGNLPF